MITTNKITIRTNEGVIDYWNGYKENYINGDIDIYNRVLVMTSDGRLIFLTRKEIERNTYEETEINYFLPQNLQERNVVVLGLAFYHVESFEIKALVFTSDRSIFSLSFLTNQRPINATTNTIYLSSSKTSPLWCSFGALEIGNGVVATCGTGKELGKIVFDKKWNGSYERIEKVGYEGEGKDSLQIFQTKEGYEIVWNSNKLKNVDSSRPFETYCFSVFAEYDIQTHQQVNKTVSLKKFICKTPFQKYNFVLTPSILNFVDEQNALIQSIPLDGKPVWMTTDQQILWVYTNSSLYRITSKSITNDKIDLTSFNSFEKLRVGVHRELDSSVGLVKTFVLYCWCVILDVRAIQIATKQKCNEQQEIDILYSTLQNEIPSKTGIDHHIIRYIIRQCGIDSIFIKYCSICNDIEGYIEYLMEREEHDIVFEQLTLLFQESSVFQIPNQRRMAQKLLEEYFSVLFFKNNDKMVEMLSNIEFRTFPSFFTALILYPDTQVSINFAKILLRNYESKGQFNEVICEFIFWELLRHGSDMELFEFLKEKELYLSCVETLPAKHYFNKHKRSYLYILEKKGMIKEWITTGIELIVESRNEDELIPLFEKAKELNETEFQEQAIYILNAFIKIGGTQENVIHYLKTYQIDITKTLEILPNEWHSPQLIELITENIQKNEKETNRINTELNKTIEITQNAKDFSKAMYVVEEWTCSICKEIFKRNEEVVIFPCSHAFHQTCIDIEFQKNKTPYAIEHSSNAKHYDDECLLCGQHQVELINLVYVQEDEYWKL